jgi:hypothetical protein
MGKLYAEAFVRANGYDPKNADGAKRVKAILTAAEVCETHPQFIRAAQAAVSGEFGL